MTRFQKLRRFNGRFHNIPVWFFGIAFVLFVIRLILPVVGLRVINSALENKLGSYIGKVEDFDLSLYRGAYQLQGFTIKKRGSQLPPLLTMEEIDLSLAWRALLRREITGDIAITKLVVHLADSNTESKKQLAVEDDKKSWSAVLDVIVPIKVESIMVTDSSVYFVNNDLKKPLPVSLENIDFEATDIRTRAKNVTSPFRFEAILQKHAALAVGGKMDVLSHPLKADVDFKLTGFQPNKVNSLMQVYVPIDVTEGQIDVFGEMATSNNEAVGYMKFFLKEADIVAPKQKYLSVKHFFYEILASFGNWLLKNNESKKVASYIPFEFRGGKLNVDSSEAFWSAIKNMSEQLKPGIDNTVSLATLKNGLVKRE